MANFVKELQRQKTVIQTCLRGYDEFKKSGETSTEAYYAMRQLYVETNGWFNDIFQFCYGLKHPRKKDLPLRNSLLPGLSHAGVDKICRQLNRDGYYVFPQKIQGPELDELLRFSYETPAVLQSDNGSERPDTLVDLVNPQATNYRFHQQDVINNAAAQRIMADPVVLSVAEKYFQSHATFCNVHMWWTTPKDCQAPSAALAQKYHYDMDRVKFLNFFLYLTDVDTNSGPHCYIRTSHSRKPKALLHDRRFEDEEIAAEYGPEDRIEITGPRGTLMAVDGRGFHKAKMPTAGNRLIFLISMSSSLFGQDYPRPELELKESVLKNAVARDPALCAAYDIVQKQSHKAKPAFIGARY